MIEESRAYWLVVLTLVALVAVALYQFHLLAWSDNARGLAIAAAPLSAPQDPVVGTAVR
jgi:hypothetical protein